jgi:PKD repeat protein
MKLKNSFLGHFYNLQVSLIAIICLFPLDGLNAQGTGTPSFYNSNAGTFDNAAPLNGLPNRVQCIYAPNLFKTAGTSGTAAGAGRIKYLYFRIGSIFTTNPTFSDFTIRLAQNVGTRDSFNGTTWNTSMTTVFYKTNITITGTAGNWIKIPLQATFAYNPNKSLIVEMTVSSGSGAAVKIDMGTKKTRIYGNYSGNAGTGYNNVLINLGLDIEPMIPNNAGILGLTQPMYFSAGTHDLKIDIANNGSKVLDSVRINWMMDDTARQTIFYQTSIDTQNGPNGNVKNILVGKVHFQQAVLRRVKIWTSHPNGVTDTATGDDTLYLNLKPGLHGDYYIGKSRSPYSSLSLAAKDLNSFGVSGPVRFYIDSGTYTERFELNKIGGTSKTNTILFQGAGPQKTLIQNKATSVNDWQTILVNGCDYLTLKHIGVKCLDSVLGIGIHIVASSNNLVDSCDISMHNNSWSFRLFGVCGSGSTKESTPGHAGDSNTFSNLQINGGYYGIYYAGGGTWAHNYNIKIQNNRMTDYLRNGIWLLTLTNTLIEDNVVSSQRMADVNGVTLSALNNFVCVRNRIYSVREGLYADNCNLYYLRDTSRSLMANNVVINTGTAWPAVEMKYCQHIDFYHNSLMGQATYLFRLIDVDSCDFRNNLFKDTIKGICIAIGNSVFSSRFTIDHNVYYFPGATFPISYQGTLYSSVSNWFTAVSNINQNSLYQDPMYKSYTDLNLQKGNRPRGNYKGINDDHAKTKRCSNNPTLGAFELMKGTVPDISNPTWLCTGDTLKLPITPPSGLSDSDYNKKWDISELSIQTAYGTKPMNITVTYPTSNAKGYIRMIPSVNEVDSAFSISYKLNDHQGFGCYSSFCMYLKVNLKPVADFSINPAAVCLGDSVGLSNLSTGPTNTTWSWQMGDGGGSNKKSLKYLYKAGGVFNISLNAMTSGCTDTKVKQLVISNPFGSRFIKSTPYNGMIRNGTRTQPDLLCVADTVTYELMPPTGFKNAHYDVYWKFDKVRVTRTNGVVITDTLLWKADSSHNYRIRLIAPTANEGDTILIIARVILLVASKCDSSITRYLFIAPTPKVNFTHTLACLNSAPVIFSDMTTVSAGNLSYQWEFGDGGKSNSRNNTHAYPDTGSYKVKLSVSSDLGCAAAFDKTVRVYPRPYAIFDFSGRCTGDTIQFNDSSLHSGSTITTWHWNFGNGQSTQTKNPIHIYSNAATYTVEMTIVTSNGCRDSATGYITVDKTPEPSFTSAPVCLGSAIKFTNTTTANSQNTYNWDFGDGTTSKSFAPFHQFGSAGTFLTSLTVRDSISGCYASISDSARVYALLRFSPRLCLARCEFYNP